MHDTDLAYLAGVVDADGYVTATMSTKKERTYFGVQLGITGSDPAPHQLAAELFGGRVNVHRPTRNPRHKDQHHWQLGGAKAVEPIEALLPFLRIKRDRALLVLELQAALDEDRLFRAEGGVPWLPVGHDRTANYRARVEEIRTAGRELDGRTWDQYPKETADA